MFCWKAAGAKILEYSLVIVIRLVDATVKLYARICWQGRTAQPHRTTPNNQLEHTAYDHFCIAHVQCTISGCAKREAHKRWSMMNLKRQHPLLELR